MLEDLLGEPVRSAARVGAGRNSRVYRVESASGLHAAKFYFGPTADGRDRLGVEYAALEFLWGQGIQCVPRPHKADHERHVALFGFVDGEAIAPADATGAEIQQLLEFIAELRRVSHSPQAHALPAAAEAFFSAEDVVANVRGRLERLRGYTAEGSAYAALHEFLAEQFTPSLNLFASRALAARLRVVEPQRRTLSPSDVGFHNGLRTADGRLMFLDFEYFGWDDPVKTLCDAELHPQMPLPLARRIQLASGFDALFSEDPEWRARVAALYPLFALKWCMITLNEFRPDQIARRRYVDQSPEEVHVIQMRQLESARAMLASMLRHDGRFPYWGGDPS